MRISDWSSDVCSSDLLSKASLDAGLIDKVGSRMAFNRRVAEISGTPDDSKPWEYNAIPLENWVAANPPETNGSAIAVVPVVGEIVEDEAPSEFGRASCRERVCLYV